MSRKQKSKSSRDYTLYKSLYPMRPGTMVLVPFRGHPEWKKELDLNSERFNLAYIANFFKAFSEHPLVKSLITPLVILKEKKRVFVNFDNLQYRAEMVTYSHTDYKGVQHHNLSIKLSNDGFLYKPQKKSAVKESDVALHKSDTYDQLNHSEFSEAFDPMWDFADIYLGAGCWSSEVYYNYMEERMDIKFEHDDQPFHMEITFEPGYPERPFTDAWRRPQRSKPAPTTTTTTDQT